MRSPSGNVAALLERLGRSSTPAVAQAANGITLAELLGLNTYTAGGQILFIGSPELRAHLASHGFDPIWAVPGAAVEQARSRDVECLVIDNTAFDCGPWFKADSGSRQYLAQEVFDTGRQIRARGGIVFYLPRAQRPLGVDESFVRSTSTVNLGQVPEEDLEEDAPQSKLWSILERFLESKNGRNLA